MWPFDGLISKRADEQAKKYVDEYIKSVEDKVQGMLKEASVLTDEDKDWVLMSDSATSKDLPFSAHKDQQTEAWLAFMSAPMGKRQVENGTSYLVGKGFQVTSIVPEIQKVINDFVGDPENYWVISTQEIANSYQINGEVPVIIYVNKRNGRVLFRDIDPGEITAIERDPNDPRKLLAMRRVYHVQKWDDKLESPTVEEKVDVIRQGEDSPGQPDVARYFEFFRVPTVSKRVRGLSQLASHLYWLKLFRKILDSRAILEYLRACLVWDVSVEGTPADVEAEALKNKKSPKPGAVKVHSSTITWEAKSPNLGANDAADDIRAIKLQVVAGSNQPEHVVTGDISSTTYAGGESQMRPFHMYTYRFQGTFGYFVGRIVFRVIEAAIRYGELKGKDGFEYIPGDDEDQVGTLKIRAPKKPKVPNRPTTPNSPATAPGGPGTPFEATAVVTDPGTAAKPDDPNATTKPDDSDTSPYEPEFLPVDQWFQIVFPVVEKEDELRQSRALQADYMSGWVSNETAAQRRGYNFYQEQMRIAMERKAGIFPPSSAPGFRGRDGGSAPDGSPPNPSPTQKAPPGQGREPSGTSQPASSPGSVDK